MRELIKALRRDKWALARLPWIAWFNLRHFPLRQAVRLPVFLRRTRVLGRGSYIIDAERIVPGMIRFGHNAVSIYPDHGTVVENNGTITFHGSFDGRNGSAISVGPKGRLELGDRAALGAQVRVVCYHRVTLGDVARIGWESIVTDTDFHSMKHDDGTRSRGWGEVRIGARCWVGMRSIIRQGAVLADDSTVAATTMVAKDFSDASRCIVGGNPARILRRGSWRDIDDDALVIE